MDWPASILLSIAKVLGVRFPNVRQLVVVVSGLKHTLLQYQVNTEARNVKKKTVQL